MVITIWLPCNCAPECQFGKIFSLNTCDLKWIWFHLLLPIIPSPHLLEPTRFHWLTSPWRVLTPYNTRFCLRHTHTHTLALFYNVPCSSLLLQQLSLASSSVGRIYCTQAWPFMQATRSARQTRSLVTHALDGQDKGFGRRDNGGWKEYTTTERKAFYWSR